MSIYVTGDCHALTGGPKYDLLRLGSKRWKEGKELTQDDYVIILGDFGVIWNNEPDEQERYLLKWLNQKKWTTLFVDGNHENHARLAQLPVIDFHGGKVGKVTDKVFHLRRGEIFDFDGTTFFVMGGAASYDKEHRIVDVSWWAAEEPSYAEVSHATDNLAKHDYKVDYILAHTLPETVARSLGWVDYGTFRDKADSTRKFLDFVISQTEFKDFYCGHWHDNVDFGKFHILYEKIVQVV